MSAIPSTSGHLHCEFVRLLLLQTHRETEQLLISHNPVYVSQVTENHLHFRLEVFSSQFKSKIGHILTKTTTLRIMLNIDGSPIASRSHSHPSHTQNTHLVSGEKTLTECFEYRHPSICISFNSHFICCSF